jgi:hypothetical protein
MPAINAKPMVRKNLLLRLAAQKRQGNKSLKYGNPDMLNMDNY